MLPTQQNGVANPAVLSIHIPFQNANPAADTDSNNSILYPNSENPTGKDSNTDKDGLTDWDEVDVERWKKAGLIYREDNGYINLPTLKQALSFLGISAIICVCEVVFFYLYQYAAIAGKTMQFIGVCIEILINTALFINWGLFTAKTAPGSTDKPKSSISIYAFILLLLIIGIPLIWNSIT